MDFLVEFEINVPKGTPESEVTAREDAESAAAAKLVDQGHLIRLWKRRVAPGESRPIGLYRAESEARHRTACCARCRSMSGCASRSRRWSPIPTIRRSSNAFRVTVRREA